MKQTIKDFFKRFPDDETCLLHLFNVRFGQGSVCQKCERTAKWYLLQGQKAFSCQWCGHHIHPMVGTLFEGSHTSLQSWFYAIYLFTTTRHGVSAKELQRQLGVTYKTAWRMGHEIRKHMARVDGDDILSGDVEADETYIGGKKKGGKRGRGSENKTIVFGMVERDGNVMAEVVENVKKKTRQPIIKANIQAGSDIFTDELKSYGSLAKKGYKHQTVNHSAGEYVRGEAHTNSVEGFWSIVKRSIRSTHVHVSKKYTRNYIKEFEYRYNSRQKPEEMFLELLTDF